MEAGTLLAIPPGASAPPAEFGYVIAMLLEQVEMELRARQPAAATPRPVKNPRRLSQDGATLPEAPS